MKNALSLMSLAAVAVAGGIAFTTLSSAQNSEPSVRTDTSAAEQVADSRQITMWRSPGCGCCDAWGEYMEEAGYTVKTIDDPAFDRTAISVGVPEQGLGCHLAKVGDYFVSGLVPADVIDRLLKELPDIAGITLPGMPGNAPGMASEKTGTLKTYAFGPDGIAVYFDG